MRKTYMLFITLTVLLATLFSVTTGIASAESLTYDEGDLIFLQAVEELAETESKYNNLIAEKEVIYDVELNALGYVYDFSVNNERGYAIVINTVEGFQLTEIYFGAVNPFLDMDCLKVYVSQFIYAEYYDGYYALESGVSVTKEELQNICDNVYFGGGELTYSSEEISYTYKSENYYNLATRFPSYTSNLNNSCSPVAGANIIAYFDRFCPNLIPNYSPGISLGNAYIYNTANSNTSNVISRLYNDMGTNLITPGTTVDQFLNGMQSYSLRQGYSIAFNNCMSGNSFNYTYAKQQIEDGHPIAFFLSKFNVTKISAENNLDELSYLLGNANHMVVGFGYNEITYNFSNGSTRTDKYINVASGLNDRKDGFFNISVNSTIDAAYSVNIF